MLLVLLYLLENLDVVLSVFALQAPSNLLSLLVHSRQRALTTFYESSDDGVECLNRAGGGIQSATDSPMSARLLVQELDEGSLATSALVWERCVRTLGEELDGRVRLDTLFLGSGFGVRGLGVDFGDGDVRFEAECLSEGFPGRSQSLAVCSSHVSKITTK